MAKKAAPKSRAAVVPSQDGIAAIAASLAVHFANARRPILIAQIGAGPGNGDLTQAILQARPNFNVVILEKSPELLAVLHASFRQQMQQPPRVMIPNIHADQSIPSFVAQHPHRRFAAAVCMNSLYALSPVDQVKVCAGVYNIIETDGIFLASEPVVNVSGAELSVIEAAFRQRMVLPATASVPMLPDTIQVLNTIIGKDRFKRDDSRILASAPIVGATFRAVRKR